MTDTLHPPKKSKKVRMTVAELQELKDFNALADADELEIEIPAPVADPPPFQRQETQSNEGHDMPPAEEGVGAKITRWLRQW